jgi:hypothetical protein
MGRTATNRLPNGLTAAAVSPMISVSTAPATLPYRALAHQCRDGLGARMCRHRMSAAARTGEWPVVYLEMSQGNVQVGRLSEPIMWRRFWMRHALDVGGHFTRTHCLSSSVQV